MFKEVPTQVSFPRLEEEILAFWKKHGTYQATLKQRQGAPRFVFYEGPPTANGLPHPGHCLTRAIKDLFPRYRTMRGYLCERRAGWDTHGLPVEVEVCKELGIHSKEEIEEFGVEPFIQKCQQSVWRYMQQWEHLTERLGFWVDLDTAYVTYHQSFVESVWWSLQTLFNRGLLYQGHKIVWWWAQGGTALSSGEVGQGYREVADPSVYVRFPLVARPNVSLLVWTTTPWTLPSNQFAAVHPDLEYVEVVDRTLTDELGATEPQHLVIAQELLPTIEAKMKRELPVVATMPGSQLIGQRYVPPFDYYHHSQGERQGTLMSGGTEFVAWRVVPATFVTTDSGTGVVHQAPAFGEVDYDILIEQQARFAEGEGPELICAVGPDGKFTNEAPPYQGRWVKEADKDINRQLRGEGKLYHLEQYVHDYPFCWRADQDPLIQYPRRSWFVRTTQFRDRMLANNANITWLPEHIRDGRFGNFLESNVDWALSRERYWGTPLPIWQCEQTGYQEAIGSYDELVGKPGVTGMEVWQAALNANPELPEHLKVHKPYIDAITYDSPTAKGARMRRVPEVIDCWYDSGAMPFAQWGYPHQHREEFAASFPADFISEALDQTRGWFYSLLAISTLLFGDEENADDETPTAPLPHPYRNCIVLGLMLAEWWESEDNQRFLSENDARQTCGSNYTHKIGKMSKQLRNYRSPQEIFDTYGADALRWYFFANQAPWNSIIYSERAIKDSIPRFLLTLWNVYSFFVNYARIDGFDPAARISGNVGELAAKTLSTGEGYRPANERSELDRWMLSELSATMRHVVQRMDAYDNYGACTLLSDLTDALSNWYVRRGRDRYWSSDVDSPDKLDAHWTLYESLITITKAIAPFVPFLAEHFWQNLAGTFGDRAVPSVHLCEYPVGNAAEEDTLLSQQMRLVREICSRGLAARSEAKLRVRQPLAKVEVILVDDTHRRWLESHAALIASELNVEQVEFTKDAEKYISYQVLPNFKRLGPRVGKLMPNVKKYLSDADGAMLLNQLQDSGKIAFHLQGTAIELDGDDVQVRLEARQGWAAAQGKGCVVVLSTEIDDRLRRKGLARDVVRLANERRKAMQCRYEDRIHVGVVADDGELKLAMEENRQYCMSETLALSWEFSPLPNAEGVELEIGDVPLELFVRVAGNSD
ncbi:MAG: isoleucine--tRNA ligase [Pirellulaceae bacterium]